MSPKRFYIGLLKEMRQIVLQAVGSLPHKGQPERPARPLAAAEIIKSGVWQIRDPSPT